MSAAEEFSRKSRAMWASGDWDSFSRLITPVGRLVIEEADIAAGMDVLDVGTGSGGNVAIPAAQLGANVVGLDLTPELFEHARRRAAEAGVEVDWVEGDAGALPFADASFDRVLSTFGAMFAPDHAAAAAELVRVCRLGGLVAMTTWVQDGFAGEMFKLSGSYLPPPPPGVQPPPLWGDVGHINDMFEGAGVTPEVSRQTVEFKFPSVADAVALYASDFGPFITTRAALEPEGRWDAYLDDFTEIVERFGDDADGDIAVSSDYLLILARP